MSARRGHPADVARSDAGVGDQGRPCKHDTPGCPGPNSGSARLPCLPCLAAGGEE